MNVEALEWAFEQPLAPSEKFVLAMLANAADQNQVVTVSILAMSAAAGMTREAVRRVMHRLCQRELIALSDDTYPGFDGALLVSLKLRREEEEEDLIP